MAATAAAWLRSLPDSCKGEFVRRFHLVALLALTLGLSPFMAAQDVSSALRSMASSVTTTSLAISAVSPGDNNTCAIKRDTEITCWGLNDFGQSSPPGGAFIALSMSSYYGCAIRDDQTVACWGIHDAADQWIPPSGTFTSISAGQSVACAIKTNKTLACWGDNNNGQRDAPAGTYLAVSVGRFHACADPR